MSLKCILQGQDSKNLATRVELNEHIADDIKHKTQDDISAIARASLGGELDLKKFPWNPTELTDVLGVTQSGAWWCTYDILNTPFQDGMTNAQDGLLICAYTSDQFYTLFFISSASNAWIRTKSQDYISDWRALNQNQFLNNSNLLHNSIWTNKNAIVNQRDGYIIPPNTVYLSSPGGDTKGTTDRYYAAMKYDDGSCSFLDKDNNPGYVGTEYAISGYCKVGYTIDRWWMGFDSGNSNLQITNDGIIYNAGSNGDYENFSQPYLKESCVVGQLYTLSFLVDNYQNVRQVFNNKTGSNFNITENLISYTFAYRSTPDGNPDLGIQFKKGTSTLIKAAKLELGDQQTLAHKEGDTWVLNEIPDYGEELRKCQRYYRKWTGADNKPLGVAIRRESNLLELVLSLDTAMRVSPSLSFNGSFVCIPSFVWCNITSIDIGTPNTISIFLKPQDSNHTFDLDAYQINIAYAREYIALSADL